MAMSKRMFDQINRNRRVRAQLVKVAQAKAARAQAITTSEGGKARITVESGIRPGGRAYANVVSDSPAEEYGTELTPRIRALGRATREA